MGYFTSFPLIAITDQNLNTTVGVNIMARVNLKQNLLKNPELFYEYDTQDGDTPEVIASKYYDDPNRHWIFLYGNNILDPQWDLPLDAKQFDAYIRDKYATDAAAVGMDPVAYAQYTVKYYQKIMTIYDSETNTTTTKTYNIGTDVYSTLPENLTTVRTFPDKSTVTTVISRGTQSIYDYEAELNEEKRRVGIVNRIYAEDFEEQLKVLMSK